MPEVLPILVPVRNVGDGASAREDLGESEQALAKSEFLRGAFEIRVGAQGLFFCELGAHVVFVDHEEGVLLAHGSGSFGKGNCFASEGRQALSDKKVGVIHCEEDVLVVAALF